MSSQTTTNPTNSPTQGLSGIPYVGSKISLISRSGFKYEGTLYTIDTQKSTVALRDVKIFNNEGRVGGDKVYDYIVFKGSDIKDLTVCEAPQQPFYQEPPHAPPQQSPNQRERNPMQQPMFPGYGGYQNMMPPNYNPYMSPYNPYYFPQMHPYMRNFSPMPQKTETKPEEGELPFTPPTPQFGGFKTEQQEPARKEEIPKSTEPIQGKLKEPTQPETREGPVKKEEPKEVTTIEKPETKKEETHQQVKWSEIHKQHELKEPHNRNYRRGRGRGGRGRHGNRRFNPNYKSTTQGLNLGPVGGGQKFTEEFDFESNLKKFSKEEVEKELMEKGHSEETGLEKAVDLLDISEPKDDLPKKGYDKNQSFFDSISRDIKAPTSDRRKEREDNYKRDIETFGPLTINHKTTRTEYRHRRPTNYNNRRAFDRTNTTRGGRRKFNPSYQKIEPQEES